MHYQLRALACVVGVAAAGCSGPAQSAQPTIGGNPVASRPAESVATPITAQSLEDYLRQRFAPLVDNGMLEVKYPMDSSRDEILWELDCFDLKSTADIAALVPPDFNKRGVPVLAKLPAPASNTLSLLRDLMIIKDAKRYFTQCWSQHFVAGASDFPLPNEYGVTEATLVQLLGAGGATYGGATYGGAAYGGATYGAAPITPPPTP
jgi:hypothetical protein